MEKNISIALKSGRFMKNKNKYEVSYFKFLF